MIRKSFILFVLMFSMVVLAGCSQSASIQELNISNLTNEELFVLQQTIEKEISSRTNVEAPDSLAVFAATVAPTATAEPKQNMKGCDNNGFSVTEEVFISLFLDVLNGNSTFMDSSDIFTAEPHGIIENKPAYILFKNHFTSSEMLACRKNGNGTDTSGAMDYAMLHTMGDSDKLKSNYDTFHLYSLALIYLTNSDISTYDEAEDFYQEIINAYNNSQNAVWIKVGNLEYSYSETNNGGDFYHQTLEIRESDRY